MSRLCLLPEDRGNRPMTRWSEAASACLALAGSRRCRLFFFQQLDRRWLRQLVDRRGRMLELNRLRLTSGSMSIGLKCGRLITGTPMSNVTGNACGIATWGRSVTALIQDDNLRMSMKSERFVAGQLIERNRRREGPPVVYTVMSGKSASRLQIQRQFQVGQVAERYAHR